MTFTRLVAPHVEVSVGWENEVKETRLRGKSKVQKEGIYTHKIGAKLSQNGRNFPSDSFAHLPVSRIRDLASDHDRYGSSWNDRITGSRVIPRIFGEGNQ